jgi:hypothetical protein
MRRDPEGPVALAAPAVAVRRRPGVRWCRYPLGTVEVVTTPAFTVKDPMTVTPSAL